MRSCYLTALVFGTFAGGLLLAPDLATAATRRAEAPLRLAIVGLVHGHAGGFLNAMKGREDVVLVGVSEPDEQVIRRYAEAFRFATDIQYSDVDEMLDRTKPEAVAIFSDTYSHPEIVEKCARRGIHVMMEKPLAVSNEHALRIAKAAREGGVHVIVNYETTWYPATAEMYRLVVSQKAIGDVRKVVVRDGHFGPKEIGVQPEFLEWLVDPVRNGGGALTDFGCYGANLMTWIAGNERPLSVTAITQRLKSDPVYARVDDETTIILAYKTFTGVIQASWNWPFHRKDMDVYGTSGAVRTLDAKAMRIRSGTNAPETEAVAPDVPKPVADPVSYLLGVVRGSIRPDGLSSLENNLIVTEILDAARESARTGQTVRLAD